MAWQKNITIFIIFIETLIENMSNAKQGIRVLLIQVDFIHSLRNLIINRTVYRYSTVNKHTICIQLLL